MPLVAQTNGHKTQPEQIGPKSEFEWLCTWQNVLSGFIVLCLDRRSLMWVFAFAPELSTAHLVVYTRDWVFAPTLELHLSCSLSCISVHYKQTWSTETRYRLNFWYCMANLVLKESFVCCCDLKFLRNSIVFPLGSKSDKTEKTRKRMVSFQSFQVMMVK